MEGDTNEEDDMTTLNPYINFRGRARAAMEFYHSVFGGQLDVNTFADFQMPGISPEDADLVMHSQLRTEGGMVLMCSDLPSSMPLATESNITVSLSGSEDGELREYWAKLSDGATVSMPLEVAPWGDAFGELTDQFGTSWLINIVVPQGEQSAD